MSDTSDPRNLRTVVRDRYSQAARQMSDASDDGCGCAPADSSCCGTQISPADATGVFGQALYSGQEADETTSAAVGASLGCGVPTAVADLKAGETVLDLGSGAGADVLISARRVGPTGKAIGLDMTDEMLELARVNAAEAGVLNVEFRKGYIEDVPLGDDTVDVVISNCVINLSADKPRVFREMARVLKPGGQIGLFLAQGEVAPLFSTKIELEAMLRQAGLTDVAIEDHDDVYRVATCRKPVPV